MTGNETDDNLFTSGQKDRNTLFPVFFKLENLTTLVVGGGYVATEKLTAIFNNSPHAKVRVVATEISAPVRQLINDHNISFSEKPFDGEDLSGVDLAIIAIDDKQTSFEIHAACAEKRVLTNVADKPELCDFYLSSVVQKGSLKIAISTNGKSPTVAKRVKEVLNDVIPAEMHQVLDNMEGIRKKLGGDFTDKVRKLNEITSVLSLDNSGSKSQTRKGLSIYFWYVIAAVFFMVLGHIIFSAVGV